jgi:hypothetical protein
MAARLLAHCNDRRLDPVDARAYNRAARSRGPTTVRLNSLEPDERFGRPPDELAADFPDYAREQFELVLEDLREYPDSPPIVGEGPQILPDLVGAQPVFLVPTEEFQRAGVSRRQPGRRPQVVERDGLLARAIRRQATRLWRTVVVDGTLGPDELAGRLETHFAPLLDAPRPKPDLDAMRRHENGLLNENLQAAGVPRFPFACACGRSGCTERLEATPAQFAGRDRVVVQAHAG